MKKSHFQYKSMPLKLSYMFWAWLFFASAALATDQIPDRVLYKGSEYELVSGSPIETFIGDDSSSPYLFRPGFLSTALWRGVLAQWKLDGGKLRLSNVSGYRGSVPVGVTEFVFSESDVAVWFSGKLVLSCGTAYKVIDGVEYEYSPIEFEVWVEKGRVVKLVEKGECDTGDELITVGYAETLRRLEEQAQNM